MKKFSPRDATIAVTYKCNSRCRMCNIWQMDDPQEMPASFLANLDPKIRYVNLTGGEPFLHSDLPEVVRTVKAAAPRAQIIISSNGLATELITSTLKNILAIDRTIGVRISLDGLAATHDRIRGIPGIFKCAMATMKSLKDLGVTNLGFSFTIQDDNAGELGEVYKLSRALGIELAMALVQNSEIYFSKSNNRINAVDIAAKNLDFVIREELRSAKPKHWLRAFYDYGLKLYLTEAKRLLPTGAGLDSLFIDPAGRIYPSNLIDLEMGNLALGKLLDIWNSETANAIREKMAKEKISESWIICTIRGQMKRRAPQVLWWILKNKISFNLRPRR